MSRILSAWIVLCACGGDAPREPAREAHSGAEPIDGVGASEPVGEPVEPTEETSVIGIGPTFYVHDIQGLYGGWAMYVHGERVTVVEVDPRAPLAERRWERVVDPAWLEAARTAVSSALSAEVAERPGIPDEARTAVVATDGHGAVLRNAAWEGQRDPSLAAFWSPVQELRRMARSLTADVAPSYEGRADHAWRPPGAEWPPL